MSEGMVQPFGQMLGNVYYVKNGAMRISTNKLRKHSAIDHRAPYLWQRSESQSNQNIKILPSTTQNWGVILHYAAAEHDVQLVLGFLHY